MRIHTTRGMTSAGAVVVLLVLALMVVGLVYVSTSQSSQDQLSSQSKQISSLNAQMQLLASEVTSSGGNTSGLSLPVINQHPAIRTVVETWYLSPSAHQDRFNPAFIVVNQGDTIRLTFIDNDTVAHDFVIGPPYNIIVNATVPGLINDLTGQTFTRNATHNSPGVVVKGTPGNVSATYTFTASYAGIYEFVCTYHAAVGMIGYLVVLPNKAFIQTTTTVTTQTPPSGSEVQVSIANGASIPPNVGYTPQNITLVLGVNNTVVWTNNDVSSHTVTANDGIFDSGIMNPGDTFSYTFAKAGVYEYHCTIHPWMIGFVTVKAA